MIIHRYNMLKKGCVNKWNILQCSWNVNDATINNTMRKCGNLNFICKNGRIRFFAQTKRYVVIYRNRRNSKKDIVFEVELPKLENEESNIVVKIVKHKCTTCLLQL